MAIESLLKHFKFYFFRANNYKDDVLEKMNKSLQNVLELSTFV